MKVHKLTIAVDDEHEVSAILSAPPKFSPGKTPGVILAHGAGSGMDDPLLTYLNVFLVGRGYLTMRFNFPYRERGRKVPDREEYLEATYERVISFLQNHPSFQPGSLFLGGKSMGGRIASQLAARHAKTSTWSGLLLLAYPLHAPGRPDRIRDQHLRAIRVPTLFVSGTRDVLAPQDSLDDVVARLKTARVVWVQGGDHSFKMLRSSGKAAEDVWQQVSEVAADWLDSVVDGHARSSTLHNGARPRTAKRPSKERALREPTR